MQFLLELKDEREKDFLLKLLGQFDFVRVQEKPEALQKEEVQDVIKPQEPEESEEDRAFFNSAGMLSHWTITAEELRKQAWGIETK